MEKYSEIYKKLEEQGYEDVIIFENYSYDTALIGVTINNRAVYDYNKMVEWLMVNQSMSRIEAVEWIDYNTIRALPYFGTSAPIIMYPLE